MKRPDVIIPGPVFDHAIPAERWDALVRALFRRAERSFRRGKKHKRANL